MDDEHAKNRAKLVAAMTALDQERRASEEASIAEQMSTIEQRLPSPDPAKKRKSKKRAKRVLSPEGRANIVTALKKRL